MCILSKYRTGTPGSKYCQPSLHNNIFDKRDVTHDTIYTSINAFPEKVLSEHNISWKKNKNDIYCLWLIIKPDEFDIYYFTLRTFLLSLLASEKCHDT
jgi:hypothetical protein